MNRADATATVPDETVNYYYYLALITARERIEAFRRALAARVRPGNVVVEVGAGLGTYSFFAAQSGARRVYAIEKERIVHLAEQLAESNGLAEQVAFVRGDSTEVVLPEKADVLVLEDFSSLFMRRGLEELVRDALSRHLHENGVIVPHAVSLYAAPIGDPALWRGLLSLEDDGYRRYGLNLGLLRDIMLRSPHVRRVEPESLLAQPVALKTIELKNVSEYLFDRTVAMNIERTGTVYGLAGWFDLQITPDIRLSNAPSNPESVWRQVFFPFSEPQTVTAGETAMARLACVRSARTHDIWWTWQLSAAAGSSENCSFAGVPFESRNLQNAPVP